VQRFPFSNKKKYSDAAANFGCGLITRQQQAVIRGGDCAFVLLCQAERRQRCA
jgi:hypothetical protein